MQINHLPPQECICWKVETILTVDSGETYAYKSHFFFKPGKDIEEEEHESHLAKIAEDFPDVIVNAVTKPLTP